MQQLELPIEQMESPMQQLEATDGSGRSRLHLSTLASVLPVIFGFWGWRALAKPL
jgi:hypothetical protein